MNWVQSLKPVMSSQSEAASCEFCIEAQAWETLFASGGLDLQELSDSDLIAILLDLTLYSHNEPRKHGISEPCGALRTCGFGLKSFRVDHLS